MIENPEMQTSGNVDKPKALVPPAISSSDWEEAVSGWINDHIRSSPIAMNTEGWNHLMRALPQLLRYVNASMKKE